MKKLITSIFLICSISNSIACSINKDFMNEEDKIKSSKIAFIGEIININEKEITFKIEEDLKDELKEGDIYIFERSKPNNCIISDFGVGQKWHFTGDSENDPSWAVLYHYKKKKKTIVPIVPKVPK